MKMLHTDWVEILIKHDSVGLKNQISATVYTSYKVGNWKDLKKLLTKWFCNWLLKDQTNNNSTDM